MSGTDAACSNAYGRICGCGRSLAVKTYPLTDKHANEEVAFCSFGNFFLTGMNFKLGQLLSEFLPSLLRAESTETS